MRSRFHNFFTPIIVPSVRNNRINSLLSLLLLKTQPYTSNKRQLTTAHFTSKRYFSSSSLENKEESISNQEKVSENKIENKYNEKIKDEFIGKEEFTNLFNVRPVAERAAAMMIAQRFSTGNVLLKTFVEQLPKVSRNDIFQRGISVEEWVRNCLLLKLIEDENGICKVNLAMDTKYFLADEGSNDNGKVERREENEENFKNINNNPLSQKNIKKPIILNNNNNNNYSIEEELLHFLHYNVIGSRESGESNYKALNETYSSLLREASRIPTLRNYVTTLKYVEFLNILNSPQGKEAFWILHEKYICVRNPDELEPPRFVSPQPQTMVAHALNSYGGWGAISNVPTRQDVYEILKYVPIGWGNFGNLNIPAGVKKKHIRSASVLQWFRRQPFYFELRNVAGTTEIRRSIVLHPEMHGLTPEEAHERLQLQIARGEANNLAPLNTEGKLVTTSETSLHTTALLKFLTRVCPGYFVPFSLIIQRYTKKNVTIGELILCAKGIPDQFEIIQLKYTDTVLVRKRIGADSSRWRENFIEDFEKYPEDVRGLIIIMGRVCTSWDRPHYVYVRLTEEEKMIIGGFENMMQILQRHPNIFRVGENFIIRVDLSDPLSSQEPEPRPDDMTTRVVIRDENPYHSPRDLAIVFHYVAPDDEPCTASFFLQCASPAMRAVLPPRLVTVLQLFPDLFVCKETSPGVFLMRKVKKSNKRLSKVFDDDDDNNNNNNKENIGRGGIVGKDNSKSLSSSSSSIPSSSKGVLQEGENNNKEKEEEEEDIGETLDLEAEFAESDFLSKEEVIQAVKALVPTSGVEASQLLLWASIGVQQAANRHYGGVLKLVESNRNHFRIQESQETKMIYPAG